LREVKECNRQLEAIRRTNADVARETLEKRPAVTALREEAKQTLDICKEIEKAYEEKVKGAGGGTEGGVDGVCLLLERQVGESERGSEECARAFVAGEKPLEAWQFEYLKERKLFHERSAKLEKVQRVRSEGR
jgi:hypothetical protein